MLKNSQWDGWCTGICQVGTVKGLSRWRRLVGRLTTQASRLVADRDGLLTARLTLPPSLSIRIYYYFIMRMDRGGINPFSLH